MNQRKLSVSISPALAGFIDEYRANHGLGTKSSVVEEALELLREKDLEAAYAAASLETDEAWEATVADGLTREKW